MNAQPNASSESGTFPLGNLRNRHEMAPLFRIREASLLVHHFDLLVDYLLSKTDQSRHAPNNAARLAQRSSLGHSRQAGNCHSAR
jgi:hypothetical protein